MRQYAVRMNDASPDKDLQTAADSLRQRALALAQRREGETEQMQWDRVMDFATKFFTLLRAAASLRNHAEVPQQKGDPDTAQREADL